MEENKGQGLLCFLKPSLEKLKILTVENSAYLPAVHEIMPNAELYAVILEEEIQYQPEFAALPVHWQVLDYRDVPLPYDRESFDYIIAEHCLENAGNPQDIAAGFGTFIRQTGFFLTSFANVRHWKMIQELMEGHYYPINHHMFARQEMERLLFSSFYKEVVFTPHRLYAPDDFVERLEEFGFENLRHDLETEIWLVKAARSTPEIAVLKSLYTPEIRRRLVTLLRRVEYDIDRPQNLAALWRLIEKEGIFPDYLAGFMRETIIHSEAAYGALMASVDAAGRRTFAAALLQAALGCYTDEKTQQVLQKLEEAYGYDGSK